MKIVDHRPIIAEADCDLGFYIVEPKTDCAHCQLTKHVLPVEDFKDVAVDLKCACCEGDRENWICLGCKWVGCGRHVESHMLDHNKQKGHPIVLSLADLSFWCYECDSYIQDPQRLNHVTKHFYPLKFGPQENLSALQKQALYYMYILKRSRAKEPEPEEEAAAQSNLEKSQIFLYK